MKHVIGVGRLTWEPAERISDRYGSVWTYDPDIPIPMRIPEALVGRRGTLRATVLQARRSGHIGDLFRGISPPEDPPRVGAEYVLGHGILFTSGKSVGLRPDDGRTSDWLDPHMLYMVHEQTVRLVFEED